MRTETNPIRIECSVNDFVNECPLNTVVPIADRLPCGVVVSVDDVCATGEIFTGELPPPQYSGRWSLASGDVTLKCPFITSIYREPERACFSKNFCVANASLSWFIVAAVAVVRSAYKLFAADAVPDATCTRGGEPLVLLI